MRYTSQSIAENTAWTELAIGGGIAGLRDLVELENAGFSAALVGSALHDGRLGPDELARFRKPS